MKKFTPIIFSIILLFHFGVLLYPGQASTQNETVADVAESDSTPSPLILLSHGEPIANPTQPLSRYYFAPANLESNRLDNLSIVTFIPEGTQLEGLETGWIDATNGEAQTDYSLDISYRIKGKTEWESWSSFAEFERFQSEGLRTSSLDLQSDQTVDAVRFRYGNLPRKFRWGNPNGMPHLELSSNLRPGTRIETCSSATFTLSGNEENAQTCTSLAFLSPSRDFVIGVTTVQSETNGMSLSPAYGAMLELDLLSSQPFSTSDQIELAIKLPNWAGVTPDLLDQSGLIAAEALKTGSDSWLQRLSWISSTLSNTSNLTLSLPIQLDASAPSGKHQVEIYVLANADNQTCWQELAHGQDIKDLDGDGNLEELYCRLTYTIEIDNDNGLTASKAFSSGQVPGGVGWLDLTLTNTGENTIRRIDHVETLPSFGSGQDAKLTLLAPIQVPDGLKLFYSTDTPLCHPKTGCPAEAWETEEPLSLASTTGILFSGELAKPLLPGQSLTFPLFVQLGSEWPISRTLTWEEPTYAEQGISFEGEATRLSFGFELTATAPLTTGIVGYVWEEIERDGEKSGSELGVNSLLLKLWSVGPDGLAQTGDDLMIGQTFSNQRIGNQTGIFHFGEAISGTLYYVEYQPQPGSNYLPIPKIGGSSSSFDPDSLTTSPFLHTDATGITPTLGLGVEMVDSAIIDGFLLVDHNQNGQLDEPTSAGANNVLVHLVSSSGSVVESLETQSDPYGRPGYFQFTDLDISERYRVEWVSAVPFVEQREITQSADQDGIFRATTESLSPRLGDRIRYNLLMTGSPIGADSGDAPESYGDAFHLVEPHATIGLISDINPLPVNDKAYRGLGDDQQAVNDEDGVIFVDGGIGTVAAEASELIIVLRNQERFNQQFNGWIDFNADGFFAEEEQIIKDHPINIRHNPQALAFQYDIPRDAVCGDTYARFRLGDSDGSPVGLATVGEVEDFPYTIQCVADLEVQITNNANPVGQNEILNWYMSVENEGPSTANDVVMAATIPANLIYQGHVSLTNDPVECNDAESINFTRTIRCTLPQLKSNQAITINLATVVPFDYDGKRIETTVTASTSTPEKEMAQNYVRQAVTVEKQWVLGPLNLFTFTHVDFYGGFIDNPELKEQDFKIEEEIISHINVPISIAVGIHADAEPFITIPACIESPEEVSCNNTNYILGQLVLESYSIEEVSWNEDPVYRPEEPIVNRLYRIANSNLSSCGDSGSCVGYQLFRVGRGDVRPYAWTAPEDYFYLNFVTSGGRDIECPDIYEERCVIIEDAKPGTYRVDGTLRYVYQFDDPRLAPEPIDVYRERPFRTTIRVFAPFIEPDR
ncbi:MAG: GEVED domain-containing protein [Chloroflexota bacterium]